MVLALVASCGRLGFGTNSIGDGGSDTAETSSGGASTVRVVVTTDYSLTGSGPFILPGMPVESATVLADRGAAALERQLTDAQGASTLSADGLVAYHVVHGSSDRWRVYTVATGATGTISLGASGVAAGGGRVTLVLPSGSGNEFSAHIPEHCQSIFEPFSTPSVSIDDIGACDGQVVHVIGFISTDLNNTRYVDAGMVKVAAGMRSQVVGTYAPLLSHSIELTHVPAEAKRISAQILARNQLDLTRMESDSTPTPVAVTGPAMTWTTAAGAGGDTVRVVADVGRAGRAVRSTSQQISPVSFSAAPAAASFDASTLLPAFTSLDFDARLNLTWVGGGTTGTMIVVQVLTDSFEWDAYLPPTATSLAFPVIPADIGFPRTFTVYDVRIMRIDVPGATAVGLTPAIDQTWRRWPHDAALFPASGNRMAEARYISGLFTDPSPTVP